MKKKVWILMRDRLLPRRIAMALVGMAIAGFAIGFFKRAFFGVDPFQCFCNGLNQVIPIGFGTLYMLINAVLLLIDFFLDRHYIGISTFINLFLVGYAAEFSEKTLATLFGDLAMPGRILFLIIGIVVSCIAAALYYTADLGVSTYDAVSLIISEKQQKVPFRFCRIISDLTVVVLGTGLCLLAGYSWKQVAEVVGIGTIITAFFMGPLIEFFNVHAARPFLLSAGKEEFREK